MNLSALKAYVVARAAEASTWRGLILVATSLGAHIKPELTEAIVLIGVGLAGGVGVAFPDKPPAKE